MKSYAIMTSIASFAAALCLASAPAQAGLATGPCQADVVKLCPDAHPGDGSVRKCVRQHSAELSPACKEHVNQLKARWDQWRAACRGDVEKLCGEVEPGRGAVRACLRQHRAELSQTCKDQIAKARETHRRLHPAPKAGDSDSGTM